MKKIIHSASLLLLACALLLVLFGCVSGPRDLAEQREIQVRIDRGLSAGWTELWGDRYREAEKHFRDVLEIDEHCTEAHRGLGLALFARGAYFEAAEELMAAIREEPTSPYAVPMRDFILTQIPFRRELRSRLNRVNELLADQVRSPWLRREGLIVLQDFHSRIDPDPRRVLKVSEQLGVVSGWRLLGPFSNVSGSGFSKPYIREKHIEFVEFDKTHLGLDNRTIAWITPSLQDSRGAVSFSEYLSSPQYSTFYAYTTVDAEEEGDYYLIFDQAGTLQCWLDDEPVLCDSAYRYGSEMHWIKRRLERGLHTVLVKVTNKRKDAGFKLSVQKAEQDIYADRDSAVYGQIFPEDRRAELFGFDPLLASLAARVDASDRRRESCFWLSYMLSLKGHGVEGLEFLEHSRELHPDSRSAYFTFLESLTYRTLGKTNEARNTLLRAYDDSAPFAPAVAMLLQEYVEGERRERLEGLLRHAEKAFGPWYHDRLYRVWLAVFRDGVDGAIDEMEQFYQEYPDSPELDLMLLDSPYGFKAYSAATLMERVRDRGLPILATLRLMRIFMEWEDYASAFVLADTLQEHLSASEEVWSCYARCAFYGDLMDHWDLKEMLSDLLENFPFSEQLTELELSHARNTYYGLKQYQREENGSAELEREIEAEQERYVSILEKFLDINPQAYALRTELRELKDEAALETLFPSADALERIRAFESDEPEYGDEAVVVLREDTLMFFGDGASRSYRQDVIKILRRSGVPYNSTYHLDFHPLFDYVEVLEACVLKPDGSSTGAVRAYDRLSFPGLAVGDYIVVRYARDSRLHGALNREIWGQSPLNSFYPIYRREVRIIHPDDLELTLRYHNQEGREIEEQPKSPVQGLRELRIRAEELEPVGYEGWMPDWQDVVTWIDFSSVESWSRISQWYRELYQGQCIITPKIREKVDTLCAGAADRQQKILALYDFVSREIEYEDLSFMYSAYVPQEAESVLEDGYGDCKDQCILLITMLHAAGIDAHIALSTPDYRGGHFFLPSARFSHTIVLVPEAEQTLILDPTTQYYSYPELPASMIGSYYLPIPTGESAESTDLQRIAAAGIPRETFYLVEFLPSAEHGAVRGTAIYAGFHAGKARSALVTEAPQYRKQAFAWLLQEGVSGFIINTLEAENAASLEDAPIVAFSGTVPGSFTRVGEGLFSLEIPWFVRLPPEMRNIGATEERTNSIDISDLDLSSPCRQVTVVEIPEGYELYSLPEDEVVETGGASAVYRYSRRRGKLICERFLHIPLVSVSPEGLEELNRIKERIFSKEQERIILRYVGR